MRIDLDELVVLLGRWDQGRGPLYRQLSDGLRRLFEIGRYEAGERLPPERQLAASLAVSRNTVAAAYGDLRAEGWVQARQGSATVIASVTQSPAASHKESGLFASLMQSSPEVLDLTVAVPRIAPILEEIIARPGAFVDLKRLLSEHGLHAHGSDDLRQRIAAKLSASGFATEPNEILITTGAQQAISLITRAMIRPGDAVAVDEITFPGALDAIRASNGVAQPVRVGSQGTDIDDLRRVIHEHHPRLLYTIPTFHNPTGHLLRGAQREQLIATIRETELTVIDDMTLGDLGHTVAPPLPLAAAAPEASILTVGSLSKVFWGGLRVGWIRARSSVISMLASHKVSHDLASSSPSQIVALAALDHFEATQEWRNEELRRSLDALGNEVSEQLPDWRWTPPDGGPYSWLQMPGADSIAFAQLALRRGVAVVPGSLLSVTSNVGTDRIRLPLYPAPEEICKGISALAAIWSEYLERGSRSA